jgi:hypothetical protein
MSDVSKDRGGSPNFRRLFAGSVDVNSPPRGNARTRDGTFVAPKAAQVGNKALRPLERAVDANQQSADALNQAVREVSCENQAASGAWASDVEAAANAAWKLSDLLGNSAPRTKKDAQPATRACSSSIQRLLG